MLKMRIYICIVQGVTHRRRDAQLAVRELLKDNVILVGHALHHDLLALRIDYQPVIDTSLLISYRWRLLPPSQLVLDCLQGLKGRFFTITKCLSVYV